MSKTEKIAKLETFCLIQRSEGRSTSEIQELVDHDLSAIDDHAKSYFIGCDKYTLAELIDAMIRYESKSAKFSQQMTVESIRNPKSPMNLLTVKVEKFCFEYQVNFI